MSTGSAKRRTSAGQAPTGRRSATSRGRVTVLTGLSLAFGDPGQKIENCGFAIISQKMANTAANAGMPQ